MNVQKLSFPRIILFYVIAMSTVIYACNNSTPVVNDDEPIRWSVEKVGQDTLQTALIND